jgi:hypothetical protein
MKKTQKDFAPMLGTSLNNLKSYENTAVMPKAPILLKLASISCFTHEELLNTLIDPLKIMQHVGAEQVSEPLTPRDRVYHLTLTYDELILLQCGLSWERQYGSEGRKAEAEELDEKIRKQSIESFWNRNK